VEWSGQNSSILGLHVVRLQSVIARRATSAAAAAADDVWPELASDRNDAKLA